RSASAKRSSAPRAGAWRRCPRTATSAARAASATPRSRPTRPASRCSTRAGRSRRSRLLRPPRPFSYEPLASLAQKAGVGDGTWWPPEGAADLEAEQELHRPRAEAVERERLVHGRG